jgi:hypothetical protein
MEIKKENCRAQKVNGWVSIYEYNDGLEVLGLEVLLHSRLQKSLWIASCCVYRIYEYLFNHSP